MTPEEIPMSLMDATNQTRETIALILTEYKKIQGDGVDDILRKQNNNMAGLIKRVKHSLETLKLEAEYRDTKHQIKAIDKIILRLGCQRARKIESDAKLNI